MPPVTIPFDTDFVVDPDLRTFAELLHRLLIDTVAGKAYPPHIDELWEDLRQLEVSGEQRTAIQDFLLMTSSPVATDEALNDQFNAVLYALRNPRRDDLV